ncbi:hypothetical protein GCM10023107_61650 [Actinoplanes octamycinicus]
MGARPVWAARSVGSGLAAEVVDVGRAAVTGPERPGRTTRAAVALVQSGHVALGVLDAADRSRSAGPWGRDLGVPEDGSKVPVCAGQETGVWSCSARPVAGASDGQWSGP